MITGRLNAFWSVLVRCGRCLATGDLPPPVKNPSRKALDQTPRRRYVHLCITPWLLLAGSVVGFNRSSSVRKDEDFPERTGR